MPKTTYVPTIKGAPQVVLWNITATGADEAHDVGHNLNQHTLVFYNSGTGAATVTIQVSMDGTTWIDHPSLTNLSIGAGAAAIHTVTGNFRYWRPNVSSGTGFSLKVWLVSAR